MTQITLLDGGMSREIEACGGKLQQPEWSAYALIHSPDAVLAAHRNFVRAGAQVITSNSYALVPFHIGEDRFRDQGQALAAQAGQLARRAADAVPGTKVAGAIPPLFGSYRPDLFDEDRAEEILTPLIAGLMPHADLWLIETTSSVEEAEAAVKALQSTGKPIWLAFTLDDMATELPLLRSGEPVADAVAWAKDRDLAALLFNCSVPEVMQAAVALAQETELPIGVYANAFAEEEGEALDANDGLSAIRQDLTPERYADWAIRWAEAGATILGGCCGVGSDHIARLADRFKT